MYVLMLVHACAFKKKLFRNATKKGFYCDYVDFGEALVVCATDLVVYSWPLFLCVYRSIGGEKPESSCFDLTPHRINHTLIKKVCSGRDLDKPLLFSHKKSFFYCELIFLQRTEPNSGGWFLVVESAHPGSSLRFDMGACISLDLFQELTGIVLSVGVTYPSTTRRLW